jgi:hypothetical protein
MLRTDLEIGAGGLVLHPHHRANIVGKAIQALETTSIK